jgi:DHA2 family multidrug resistance protein-like MFS transporter
MVAMVRLIGQTLGAALAAFCFFIAGSGGATLALWLGAGFGALGCVLSVSRLAVQPGAR